MNIGNVKLKNKVFIAPMAGVSNYAFRKIMTDLGAGLVYAEMISDKAIYYQNEKTQQMAEVRDDERPISMQLFGGDVDTMVHAAKFVDKNSNCDIIDINFGCPVAKVAVKAKAGSHLLRDPQLCKEIVESVVAAVDKPVTVKIRTGWDSESINAVEIAKICEAAGAKAIAVHGRTRQQKYAGTADWNIIKDVKQAVSIPVIGNGDIFSPEDAKRMLEETGVDAIMMARGVRNYPFLAKQCVEYLETGKYSKPTSQEIKDLIWKHANLLWDLKKETGMKEMRGHIAHYLKGVPNSKVLLRNLYKLTQLEHIKEIIDRIDTI